MAAKTLKQQTVYVALLRGINVGGNNKVEMQKLKVAFSAAGFTSVSTHINSGNVIFSTNKNHQDNLHVIQALLKGTFPFPIPVLLREAKAMHALVKAIPGKWKNDEAQRTDVLFLWDEVDSKTTLKEISQNPDVDELLYCPGAIVWHFDRKYYNKSAMHKFIGTRVYKLMTARNINAVRKLAGLIKTE